MKECIYQKKHHTRKIQCAKTGTLRWHCDKKVCKYYKPTLRYRISEWVWRCLYG